MYVDSFVMQLQRMLLLSSGELEVAAEYNARDSDAVRSVDFVILKNQFVISVLEVSGSSCCSS